MAVLDSLHMQISLEGPLEVPKIGDMICSTPANEDACQWGDDQGRNPKPSPGHCSTGKSAHINRDIDAHYDVIKVGSRRV